MYNIFYFNGQNYEKQKQKTNEKTQETIKYKVKLIDTYWFVSSSPSNLTDNFSEKLSRKDV